MSPCVIVCFSLLVLSSAVHVCLLTGNGPNLHAGVHAVRKLQAQGQSITFEIFIQAETFGDIAVAGGQRFIAEQANRPLHSTCSFIIGPQTSAFTLGILPLANLLQLPVIGFSATSPALDENVAISSIPLKTANGKYPYFARVVPSDNLQAQVYADLLAFLQYHLANFIFTQTSYGEGLYTAFRDKFRSMGGLLPVVESFGFHEADSSIPVIITVLKQSSARVTMAVISGTANRLKFLDEAMAAGLFSPEWFWVLSEAFLWAVLQKPLYTGVVVVFMKAERDRLKDGYNETFHRELVANKPNYWPKAYEAAVVAADPWAPFVYDATQIAALAALAMDNASDGKMLMQGILGNTLPDGLTGQVSFTPSGQREDIHFEIYNCHSNGSVPIIGTWLGPSNIHLDLASMVWPGGAVGAERRPLGTSMLAPDFLGFGASGATVLVLVPDSFEESAPGAGDGQIGLDMRRAVGAALDHVLSHSSSNLQAAADSVVFRFRDSGCSGTLATQSFLSQLAELPPVLAVIGCHCSEASRSAARLTGAISVPQILTDSWASEFSDRTIYPHIFRISPDNCRISAVFIELCLNFNWKQVTLLSVDDTYGRDWVATFEGLAVSTGIRIHQKAMYNIMNEEPLIQSLQSIKRSASRVILATALSPKEMDIITKLSFREGLLGTGWQWLLSEAFNSTDDSLRAMHVGTFRVSYEIESINQLAGFPETMVRWEMATVDAMLAVLTALTGLLPIADFTDGGLQLKKQRQLLSDAVAGVNLSGLTGPVSFNANGDRRFLRATVLNYNSYTEEVVGDAIVSGNPSTITVCGTMPKTVLRLKPEKIIFGGGTSTPPEALVAQRVPYNDDSSPVERMIIGGVITALLFVAVVVVAVCYRSPIFQQRCHRFYMRVSNLLLVFRPKRRSQRLGLSLDYILCDLELDARAATGKCDPTMGEWLMASNSPFYGQKAIGKDKVCPRDGRKGCSYIDAVERTSTGIMTHYLSWSYRYPVSTFVDAISSWYETVRKDCPKAEIFIWVCMFCNNQHRLLGTQVLTDVKYLHSAFETRLKYIKSVNGSMIVLLDKWHGSVYVTRLWCIWEIWMAQHLGVRLEYALPSTEAAAFKEELRGGYESITQALHLLDVTKADATVEADRKAILKEIEAKTGIQHVNETVRDLLKDWAINQFNSLLSEANLPEDESAESSSVEQVSL